jgi:hypothetical protein
MLFDYISAGIPAEYRLCYQAMQWRITTVVRLYLTADSKHRHGLPFA